MCTFHIDAVAYHNAYFGPGTGPILLDDVFCLGNEKSILECDSNINPFSLINSYLHNCVHSEDAGVACLSRESQIKYHHIIVSDIIIL
jgi:hypothetical protein